MQGGFAPLQSPKSCKRIIFDRKGTWILHFWFPQILVLLWKGRAAPLRLLWKGRAAPLRPPKIIYFCKFRLKRVWNYAYLACKIQNFLRQGGAAPLQPRQGASPLHPREHLTQAIGLLALRRSWTNEVENLPKLMWYSLFYVPYLCGTHWLCMTSTLSCMKYENVIMLY